MNTNVFSRLAHSGRGRSFYQELRAREGDQDVEDRAGLLDEENLNHHFQTDDFDHAEDLTVDDSRATLDGLPVSRRRPPALGLRRPGPGSPPPDDDNDVPASLLVEPHLDHLPPVPQGTRGRDHPNSAAGQSAATLQARWESIQHHQRLHQNESSDPPWESRAPRLLAAGGPQVSAQKKAEWRWANVSNLDNFIQDVYDYYQGHGIWCILMERGLHLT